jgi:hypothetical protein
MAGISLSLTIEGFYSTFMAIFATMLNIVLDDPTMLKVSLAHSG